MLIQVCPALSDDIGKDNRLPTHQGMKQKNKFFNSLAGVGFPPGGPQPLHQHQPHTDRPPPLLPASGVCPTTMRGLQGLLHLKRCRSKLLI